MPIVIRLNVLTEILNGNDNNNNSRKKEKIYIRSTRGMRYIGFFVALNNLSVAEGILGTSLSCPLTKQILLNSNPVHYLIASYCLFSKPPDKKDVKNSVKVKKLNHWCRSKFTVSSQNVHLARGLRGSQAWWFAGLVAR